MNHPLGALISLCCKKSWTRSLTFMAKGSSMNMSGLLSSRPINCVLLEGRVLVSPGLSQSPAHAWVCDQKGERCGWGQASGVLVWLHPEELCLSLSLPCAWVLCEVLFSKNSSPDKFYHPFKFKGMCLKQPIKGFLIFFHVFANPIKYLNWRVGSMVFGGGTSSPENPVIRGSWSQSVCRVWENLPFFLRS